MDKRYLIYFIFFVIVSCTQRTSKKELPFYHFCGNFFCFELPKNYQLRVVEDTSKYTGMLISDANDTLYYSFGFNIYNLAEKEPDVMYFPNSRDSLEGINENNIIITNKYNYDIDLYRKQNVFFDTIDGFFAKIVVPRKSGIGITGIYFDSLSKNKLEENYSFHLYGKNLSIENQTKLINAIPTFSFKGPIKPYHRYGVPLHPPASAECVVNPMM